MLDPEELELDLLVADHRRVTLFVSTTETGTNITLLSFLASYSPQIPLGHFGERCSDGDGHALQPGSETAGRVNNLEAHQEINVRTRQI